MDGVVIAEDRAVFSVGRHPQNDLSLHGDMLVSSRHAAVHRSEEPGVLKLEDQGSANGTWFDGARLVAPHRMSLGAGFVIGQSVIRCSARDHRPTRRIEPEELVEERARLLDALSRAMDQGLGAAMMLACRERRGFVNDRHLFLGLALTQPDLPILDRGQGPISFEFLNEALFENAGWTGIEEWIDRHLQDIQITNFFAVNLSWSPRVIWSLQKAEELAKERGRTRIEPIDWFRAVLEDSDSRISGILSRRRLHPDGMAAELATISIRNRPVRSVSETVPRESSERFGPGALVPSWSSGDASVDHRSLMLSRRLYELASLYHLAAPEDRRAAMRQMLEQEISQQDADKRRLLLEQVRRLFPIDPGSNEGALELARLNNRIAQLEQRVRELEEGESHAVSAGAGVPWHLLVGSGDDKGLDNLSPVDQPRVEFLREVLAFSERVEKLVVAMVQGLTVQATTTTSLALPGHRLSIRAYLDDMTSGRQVRREELARYLGDLRIWLVSSQVAYHEGPELWFKELWGKISPTAIESRLQGWVKRLGVQQWEEYKKIVRRIDTEVAAQQIQFEVRKIAQQRHMEYAQREKES